jgi:hypothetical protein
MLYWISREPCFNLVIIIVVVLPLREQFFFLQKIDLLIVIAIEDDDISYFFKIEIDGKREHTELLIYQKKRKGLVLRASHVIT